jgi:hypothetical protein
MRSNGTGLRRKQTILKLKEPLGSIYQYGLYDVPKDLKEPQNGWEKCRQLWKQSVNADLAEIYYSLKNTVRRLKYIRKR